MRTSEGTKGSLSSGLARLTGIALGVLILTGFAAGCGGDDGGGGDGEDSTDTTGPRTKTDSKHTTHNAGKMRNTRR